MIFAELTNMFLADITPLKGFRADVFCPRDMLNDRTGYYSYIVVFQLRNYFNLKGMENNILNFIFNLYSCPEI